MTVGEVAQMLGLGTTSVRVAIQTGQLKVAAMTVGGMRLMTEGDVQALVRTRAERRRELLGPERDG